MKSSFSFNMSSRRPPSDTFTRFTSTTPHATTFTYNRSSQTGKRAPPPTPASSPSPSSPPTSQPSPSSQGAPPPPPNETPQEKVARLRAAHRAKVAAQTSSPIDRLIASGRVIADQAHRATAYGLILFSGLAVCVTAYGTISLVAHSRRQKRAWVERELERLDDARRAFLRGEATAEQLSLLEQESAGQQKKVEAPTARMQSLEEASQREQSSSSGGIWGRVKGLVGGTLAKGEMGQETERERQIRLARKSGQAGQEGYIEGEIQPTSTSTSPAPGSVVREAVPVTPSEIPGVGIDSKGRPVPAGRVEYISRTVGPQSSAGSTATATAAPTVRVGGPLDVMASNAVGATTSQGQGWLRWIRGGGSGSSSKPSES